MAATVPGFTGEKVYYLAERAGKLTPHDVGSARFTSYGGSTGSAAIASGMVWRYQLPPGEFAGIAAAPLALAYASGRVGYFLAGDGTYVVSWNLPWATAFPDTTVPTTVPLHPTAVYEAVVAFALAGLLWGLRRRVAPPAVFGLYAVMSGVARFLVEDVRIDREVQLGMAQPRVLSLALVGIGMGLLLRSRLHEPPPDADSVDAVSVDRVLQTRAVHNHQAFPSLASTKRA